MNLPMASTALPMAAPSPAPAASLQPEQIAELKGQIRALAAERDAAVSYTHLTLPTNREV